MLGSFHSSEAISLATEAVSAGIVFIHGADGYGDDRPLADSLGMPVMYPRMPDADDWTPAIAAAVSQAEPPLMLIGHSDGGNQLLCFLATEPDLPIASVHIIAAPFPAGAPT